ncbi:MAG TPA: flagellar assembly protein FliW [Pirellulaceae bacterium]|nr:flagellar assembly protein FliW [Pirellulaceae bacterium]
MLLETSRFGAVDVEVEDILHFPDGLIGFEDQRHWVLLADEQNESLGWLQSVRSSHVALPVVSPRRFAADYQVRIVKSQLLRLELEQTHQAFVLNVINRHDEQFTVNLKAPVIINLDRRLGRQVVTLDEQPIALPFAESPAAARKIA